MRKRNLTREERAQQSRRIMYLVSLLMWVMLLVALLFATGPDDNAAKLEQQEGSVLPQTEVSYWTEPVLVELSPVREDIPLDAEIQLLLYQVCGEAEIPYELALAVLWQETNFRNLIGDDGDSFGYMQVQPRWHSDRMERVGVTDLMDPYGNFLVGCDYLAELMEKGRGLEWALMAYNGGPSYANEMAKAGKVSQYAKDVLNYMNELKMEEM